MKLLAFTDLHEDNAAFEQIKKKVHAHKPDYLLCMGDISIFGNATEKYLKKVNNLRVPCLFIHGNHESERMCTKIIKQLPHIKMLHKKAYVVKGYTFLGYGGGGFAHEDAELERWQKTFTKVAKKATKLIVLLHGPPYKTKLDIVHGYYSGCKSKRRLIEEWQPDLVLCGHIHENEGRTDKIGKSPVIYPRHNGELIEI